MFDIKLNAREAMCFKQLEVGRINPTKHNSFNKCLLVA
jgi:hypothetical protein